MTDHADRLGLIRLLRHAYSGERAAAGAYAGHWRSVEDQETRDAIFKIEQEEWDHRRQVGVMLQTLNAFPSATLELKAALIGATLGPLCHVSGWLLPMFGAAWLEQQNVAEYESAARLATSCGQPGLAPALERMAEVELQHESYFRQQVASHPLGSIACRLLGRPTRGGSPATRYDAPVTASHS